MFKSMRLRISILFVLLVLAAELVTGLFGIYKSIRLIHKDFKNDINTIFTADLQKELTSAANAVSIAEETVEDGIVMDETGPDNVNNICSLVMNHADKFRPAVFYILDNSRNTLYSSDNGQNTAEGEVLDKAYDGNEELKNNFTANALEYALPLKSGDEVRYVLYIRDNLSVQHRLVHSLRGNLLWLLLCSAIISSLLSFFIGKMATKPIKKLAEQARLIADGQTSNITLTDKTIEVAELNSAIEYLSESKKELADKAVAEKTKVEKILENMNDGILAFDMKGRLTHINPEAQRLVNRNFVDDITFNKFFKEINANITLDELHYTSLDGFAEREIKLNELTLQFSIAMYSRDSSEGGVIVIIHDVTKHERLESARRDFVADVSHELRTPLTVIKSYADILADTPDAEPQVRTRFLNTISSETDRMTKIISDLLTLSKLDVNANYSHPNEEIDVRSMLEGLVDRLTLSARKKEQTLTYTPINDVPVIRGDRDGLERVFTNIISNALKYTPSGGNIKIFTSKVYNDILVKVSDDGIGIPKEQLPNIFDRFYRVDKARSRDKGGTGLGLAIAKQTIESSFKGKILITSELNKGTDVSVSIPIPKK